MSITEDSLSKRGIIDWPGRIAKLESNQIDPVRFAQIEAKLNQFCELMVKNNEVVQLSSVRHAEANERISAHLEESKVVREWVHEQDQQIAALEKGIIELKAQNQQLIEFVGGVKKAAWIVVTCGGVVVWWVIQKYIEHGLLIK